MLYIMREDLNEIDSVLVELTELKESVCNSKPESAECSSLENLLEKAQSLIADLNATIELRRTLDKTIIKTDGAYLNASWEFEKRKQLTILQFDSFVTRELKATAKDVVAKSQPQHGHSRGEEETTILNKAERYIRDADNVAKTVTKATYLVGAIKFGIRLLLGIPLP